MREAVISKEVKSLPVLIDLFSENLEVMGINLGGTETILEALRGKQNYLPDEMVGYEFPDGQLGKLEALIYNFLINSLNSTSSSIFLDTDFGSVFSCE